MKRVDARIITNSEVSAGHHKVCLDAGAIASKAGPGQFIMARISGVDGALLRRPLSIHRVGLCGAANSIELLYRVAGAGTEALSKKRPGESIDIMGPLGNGFDMAAAEKSGTAIIVAGGIGVAPLAFLAQKLAHSSKLIAHKKVIVLLGAKNKKELFCESDFKELGCELKIATDDGSKGHKGFVTDLLSDILSTMDCGPSTTVYVCGPRPMMRQVAAIAKSHGIQAYGSFEERMACGVGVCLGCPIKMKSTVHGPRSTKQKTLTANCSPLTVDHELRITNHESRITNHEYKMVCKDGPVFDLDEVIW